MLHFPIGKSSDESVRAGLGVTPRIITICGWCPDVWIRTHYAQAVGLQVSHGICDRCVVKMTQAEQVERVGKAGGTGGER